MKTLQTKPLDLDEIDPEITFHPEWTFWQIVWHNPGATIALGTPVAMVIAALIWTIVKAFGV